MKKLFVEALIETVLFDVNDIITTSESASETIGESAVPTETPFVPDDGFHGDDIPLG